MKKLLIFLWLLITPLYSLYGLDYIDISAPGETVIQSTPIGNSGAPHVRVDYYTSSSPGTHYKLIIGGTTYAQLRMHHNSHLTLDGGRINDDLWFYNNSYGEIISGRAGQTRTADNSHLKITGGTIGSYIGVYNNSQVEISGGHISGVLQLSGHGIATLSGSDFKIGGQSLPMGTLDISQLIEDGLLEVFYFPGYNNYQYKGDLIGILSDNSSFGVELSITHFTDYRGDTANLILIPEPATVVAVDIKPGSCPNPLNLESRGVLPVAILGAEHFDVNTIDAGSIFLEGVPTIRTNYEDVAAPVTDGNECECNTSGTDGYTDLTLKFRTSQLVEQIIGSFGELTAGDELVLTLTGALSDGTLIEGEDCVVLVGNVPRALAAMRSDITGDGIVNVRDLAVLAEYWLESAFLEY